jgi:choline dehydrogenase-like flavoprotein
VTQTPNDTAAAGGPFDLILVGTGFASTFFLHRYLQRASSRSRVLVLERGERHPHSWHIRHYEELWREARASVVNRSTWKPWVFTLTFGGGSNCWWACTPRMLPEDFRLRSLYGVGRDWPIGYDDLEEYYCDAEAIMAVSGPDDDSPYPRSRPYPLPPHRFTDPDRLLKQRFPDRFFQQPTARPTQVLPSGRFRCCASGICHACPIDSKFTILNELAHLYDDPRVTLLTGADVRALDVTGSAVRGVRYLRDGGEQVAGGDLVGLGANAIYNPAILLRSGITDSLVGRGLVEQVSVSVDVMLNGVNNFQGSSSITGLGYMLYGGERRRDRAAAMMESWNVPVLRSERGRWRERLLLKFIYEDLPQADNRVSVETGDQGRPVLDFGRRSAYAERGMAALESDLPGVLAALPVERFEIDRRRGGSEAHILCTTPMGRHPADSVVDEGLVHHRIRNLLLLGSSVFPTAAPANPTLTITALSLRAADRLFQPRKLA